MAQASGLIEGRSHTLRAGEVEHPDDVMQQGGGDKQWRVAWRPIVWKIGRRVDEDVHGGREGQRHSGEGPSRGGAIHEGDAGGYTGRRRDDSRSQKGGEWRSAGRQGMKSICRRDPEQYGLADEEDRREKSQPSTDPHRRFTISRRRSFQGAHDDGPIRHVTAGGHVGRC